MPKTKEERYLEWLERLEIPLEETVDVKHFQEVLYEEFGFGAKQVEGLTSVLEMKWERMMPAGIRVRLIDFKYYTDLRFAIRGYRGWFSYERMRRITGWEPEI